MSDPTRRRVLAAHLRWLWAVVCWVSGRVGYWIRPYDMLADRRRWRWQSAQRCGWSYGFTHHGSDR